VHAFIGSTDAPAFAPPEPAASTAELRASAGELMAEGMDLAYKIAPEVTVTPDVVDGPPTPVLLAESRYANLLVLGDSGLGGVTGIAVGSVAVQTATYGSCPVLVIRGRHDRPGPVIVGVDGSKASAPALELAVEEASLRNAELVAVHAWTGDPSMDQPGGPADECRSGERDEQRVLAEALAGIAERYPDVPIRRHVERGSARRLLAELSRAAQLLVVGDRGYGGFAGLLLGSVSQHLVYHASCSTIVARP
jgi:nucleotide-binding universal stress UspA family protein